MDFLAKALINKKTRQISINIPRTELRKSGAFDLLKVNHGDQLKISIDGLLKKGGRF